MDAIYDLFLTLLKNRDIHVSDRQWEQFELYYETLSEWNQKMNLTTIRERDEMYIKHFYDSISLSFFIPFDAINSLADIGSGAGFPSIPLKIMYPHVKVTIIDSLNKRIRFLDHLMDKLQLSDVHTLHSRAEDAARNPKLRDQFDLVTARAVARMNVLNELCLPFVKKSGLFAAMKGIHPADELNEASYSMKELNAKLIDLYGFDLPDDHKRHIVVMKKLKVTPHKYPRKPGIPMKSPLI